MADNHVPHNHFYRQFDAYAEGEQRTNAACSHAAMLLNRLSDERSKHLKRMGDVMVLLKAGKMVEAGIALHIAIEEELA